MKRPQAQIIEMKPCTGEAHSNGHIDNCMVCLAYTWGKVPADDKERKADRFGLKVKQHDAGRARANLREALVIHLKNMTDEKALELIYTLEDQFEYDKTECHELSCRCGFCA